MRLGVVADVLHEHPSQTQRVLAEVRPHQVVAGGGRVALVEDEVDDVAHRGESLGELRPAGHLERQPGLAERPLRPDDPLRDRRLRDEESTGDLDGRQSAEQPQRQRDAALDRQHGIAGDQDETQHVVAHSVVDLRLEVRIDPLALDLERRQALVLACDERAAPDHVDRTVARHGLEPGPRTVRDARLRPLFERSDERVLRELLGHADVTHDAHEPAHEASRLRPEDLTDRRVRVGRAHGVPFEHAAERRPSWTPTCCRRRKVARRPPGPRPDRLLRWS